MSPPCVAHFDGDNFGATYPGVERDEVTILAYVDAKIHSGTRNGSEDETVHFGEYFDLGEPPREGETITLRTLRRFQRFFNDRFQLYGRSARIIVHFAPQRSDQKSAETRRADAAEAYSRYRPFAVVTSAVLDGFQDEYLEAMAAKGVLVFGSSNGNRERAFLQRHPGLVWTVPPTLEKQAELVTSAICQQVVPHPVGDAGQAEMHGQPRRLGLLRTTDPRYPDLRRYAELIKAGVEDCGVFVSDATFPWAGQQVQTNKTDPYAVRNMAQFQRQDVTTVIWAGGLESEHSKAAAQLGYRPEWVVAGDRIHEGNNNGRIQEQSVWEHAYVVTTVVRVQPRAVHPCWMAIVEADPEAPPTEADHACQTYPFYADLRQLFTGLQVAGPRLTPETIDRGLHAIPAIRSTDPFVPACFYEASDYSCVKDATVGHWDPQGQPEQDVDQPGCWRMVRGGERFIGSWPDGNMTDAARPDDPCNPYTVATALFAPVTSAN